MFERFNKFTLARPRFKKFVGWVLVVFGFIALVTPLTPGGTLFFIGLELVGLRFVCIEKLRRRIGMKQREDTVLLPPTIEKHPV